MTKKKKIVISISIILSAVIVASLLFVFLHVIPKNQEKRERERLIQAYRQSKIELYMQDNSAYDDFEVDVAFLGDSLTDAYDLERFYPLWKVVNRGIAGDTTFDLENRLQVSAYDLKPKVVVMLIGGNNFSTMLENYERIVEGLKTNLPETKIVLLSLTAMNGVWAKNNEKARLNNVEIELIAQKHGCSFVDLYTPLFDAESNEAKAGYTLDGAHLSEEGYEVITSAIKPVLEGLL